jgi:peptide/nickel transport system substrate-binding protein
MVTGADRARPAFWPAVQPPARAIALVLLIAQAGCSGSSHAPGGPEPVTLRIGFGLAALQSADVGIGRAALNISTDPLVSDLPDGRTKPLLAEGWSTASDGLTLDVRLRPNVSFHSGKPVNALAVRDVLRTDLADALGPAYSDIVDIRATSELNVAFTLRARSTFLLEALGAVPIVDPASRTSGTGPFSVQATRNGEVEMQVNAGYFGGRPLIDRLVLKPYGSVRAAWADMLRGQVDMLYEVGADGLDALESSTEVNIFTFQRAFAYLLLLNVESPTLRDSSFRRRLNASIDRRALVDDALRGHAVPADGPVSPRHWAYSADLPPFRYQPAPGADRGPRHFTILFGEPSLERLAVAIQRQLQAAGVDVALQSVPPDEVGVRLRSGSFDAVLTDYVQGPNLVQPYLYWHPDGPYNFGHYRNAAVANALDRIRRAADDREYKAGVADYWRAIVDDPPAVFLAWPQRAHAVSTRFSIPADADTDILNSLHLWKPVREAERTVHR